MCRNPYRDKLSFRTWHRFVPGLLTALTVGLLITGCTRLYWPLASGSAYEASDADGVPEEPKVRRRGPSEQLRTRVRSPQSIGIEPLAVLRETQAWRASWNKEKLDLEHLKPSYLEKQAGQNNTPELYNMEARQPAPRDIERKDDQSVELNETSKDILPRDRPAALGDDLQF